MSIAENIQYKELEVAPGVYVPDVGLDYPQDDPYARMMPVNKQIDVKFDDTYPYLDNSFSFKLNRFIAYFEVFFLFFIINKLRYGVRFEGRGILRKYRKEFAGGVVSVSNHCYRWDGMSVAEALRHTLWVPMLHDHFQGPDRWYLKHFGGIPLSDGSISATKKFNEAFDYHHEHKEWIHVFAEARSWPFYKPLKPFRKGAFTMAYKYGVPVLPINLSYRKRTGIHKLFDKPEMPLITVTIGEPIFPDTTQPRKLEVDRLQKEAHAAVCALGGITHNPWPYTWNED